MPWKTKTTIILIVVLFLIFSAIPSIFANFYVSVNNFFGFGTNCYINFNSPQVFSNIYRLNGYWYFDGYGFQVENANITITQFFISNQLKFTLYADSGISTTRIYLNVLGQPTSISGANTSSYNPSTKILTLTASHDSPVDIITSWIPPSLGSGGVRLYFPASSSIGFQSPGDDAFLPIDAGVTVSSGTLQGSNVVLSMDNSGGTLKFTSLGTAVLSPHDVTIIGGTKDSHGFTTIKSGEIIIFKWKATSAMLIPVFWVFSNMSMWLGLIGLGFLFFGSVLTVKSAEDHDWKKCLIWMFIIVPIGFALIMGWIFS